MFFIHKLKKKIVLLKIQNKRALRKFEKLQMWFFLCPHHILLGM